MIDEIGKLKEASVQEGKKWKEVILKYQADLKQAESQITYLTKQRDDVLNERAANKNNKSSLSVNVDEDNAEDTIMLEAMNNLEQEIKQKVLL
jgi:hypothetical protein